MALCLIIHGGSYDNSHHRHGIQYIIHTNTQAQIIFETNQQNSTTGTSTHVVAPKTKQPNKDDDDPRFRFRFPKKTKTSPRFRTQKHVLSRRKASPTAHYPRIRGLHVELFTVRDKGKGGKGRGKKR